MKISGEISEHQVKEIQEDNSERIVKQKTSDDLICRICFDGESDNKLLISPCKCTGSMRSVHEECLKKWIISSVQDIELSTCDICKENFQMDIKFSRSCYCKISSEDCFKVFIFPLAIIIIATIFSVVLLFFADGMRNDSLDTEEKIYLSIVITACVIIQATLLWILIKTLITNCCPLKIKCWSILSVKRAEIFEETFEITHNDETVQRDGGDDSKNVKTARYKGMNIVIPALHLKTNNIENSALIEYSVDRSGPHSVRLPQNEPENVIQRMYTARILK